MMHIKINEEKKAGFLIREASWSSPCHGFKKHQHRHEGGCVTVQPSLEGSTATSYSGSLDLDWLPLTKKPPFNGAVAYHADCELTAERAVPFSFPSFPLPRSWSVEWPGSACWTTGKLINSSWLDHYTAAQPWEEAERRQHVMGVSCKCAGQQQLHLKQMKRKVESLPWKAKVSSRCFCTGWQLLQNVLGVHSIPV